VKNNVCLLVFITCLTNEIVAQVGFEQYGYIQKDKRMTLVPIFNYESSGHTYVEARYNYEDLNTFSFYMGRTFVGKDKFSYALTPMLGGIMGKFTGGSIAINAALEYGDLFFSTQSQYTASVDQEDDNYFFSWSDLGYQPVKWMYVGISTQQTIQTRTKSLLEPGIALGIVIGKWTFPLYCFNTLTEDKYLVLGINYSVGQLKRNR
jgi:hypothetical protein